MDVRNHLSLDPVASHSSPRVFCLPVVDTTSDKFFYMYQNSIFSLRFFNLDINPFDTEEAWRWINLPRCPLQPQLSRACSMNSINYYKGSRGFSKRNAAKTAEFTSTQWRNVAQMAEV